MKGVRAGALIAALLLAVCGTGAVVFAWSQEITLDRHGVRGHAVVEGVHPGNRTATLDLAIDGRPPVSAELTGGKVHVGQTVEVTYDPRHMSTVRRGWGRFGWAPTVPLSVIGLMVDAVAVGCASIAFRLD